MKICLVGAELFRAGGRTDRQRESHDDVHHHHHVYEGLGVFPVP